MGRVFDRLMPHYRELGGERVADIGLFYSLDSRFDMRSNGKSVLEVDNGADTHTRSTMQAARALIAHHLPWRMITRKSIGQLPRLKTLVLSNVHHLSEDEAKAVRAWVEAGGTLYASGATSLVKNTGQRQPDFMLSDVFGLSLVKADWTDREHYVAPTEAGRPDFPGWDTKYPAFVRGPTMDVRADAGSTVLATRTLPWPAPDARSFSSIHSNPPWQITGQPEVVYHRFGQGAAIYSASLLEEVETLQETFVCLLRRLCVRPAFEVTAHPAVEVTLFHQPDCSRYVLSLVNFQHDLPNVPWERIPVTVRVPGRIRRIEVLPTGRRLSFRASASGVGFLIPRLETLARVVLKLGEGNG
jgi:hypothetical protein